MSDNDIHRVAVLGAGTMGSGIAQVCAMAGYDVALHDPQEDATERALNTIRGNLEKGVDRGKVSLEMRDLAMRSLRKAATLADAAATADLVLTMTREHRRAVLELDPRGLRRTFTLPEALRVTEELA